MRVLVVVILGLTFSAGPLQAVTISDGVIDEQDQDGQDIVCFRIVTTSATYYYDKQGGGFTSLIDRDGVDWINYSRGGGEQGEYRGIPNTGEFHPGYTGGSSWTDDPLDTELDKVTVHSARAGFGATWEFFETHARMTLHTVNGEYWLLYEGTPGGQVGPDDVWWRSDGTSSTCWDDPDWTATDITNTSGAAEGSEWVFFSDGTLERSLFLIHNDDTNVDDYWQMGGTEGMTVFGFGRNGWMNMTEPDAVLVIGFVESRDYDVVKNAVDSAYTGEVPDSVPPAAPQNLQIEIQ